MYDACRLFLPVARKSSRILEKLGIEPRKYVLMTAHRAETVDDDELLRELMARVAKLDTMVIFPAHPRTQKRLETLGLLPSLPPRFRVVSPVGYLDMLVLEAEARVVLTDSGGVQREAFFLSVPSVILRNETEWQIRLTDFGSGRLLDPERLNELGITRFGMTVTTALSESDATGTFVYLAPELIARQTPTVKSDIYALGIILYQLVAGDLRKPMVSGWQRNVDDELLCEDIGAATDGDPHHRLNSVAELSDRIRRLDARRVHREQVQAADRESAALAEAVKRSRMRRPWIIALIAALMLGIIVGVFFYFRLHVSEQALARQNEVVQRLNSFLTEDFIGAANPSNTGRSNVTVIEAARAAAKRIDSRFGSESAETRATLHEAMRQTFSKLRDFKNAIDEARKALAAVEQIKPTDPDKIRVARMGLASALLYMDEFRESGELLEQLEKEIASNPRANRDLDFLSRFHIARGSFYMKTTGSIPKGIAEWQLARGFASQLPTTELRESADRNLVIAYSRLGDYKSAEHLSRDIIASQSARGDKDIELNRSRSQLGGILIHQRRFDEALAVLTEAWRNLDGIFGPGSYEALSPRNDIAQIHYEKREFAKAAAEWEQVARDAIAVAPAEKTTAIIAQANQSQAVHKLGDSEQAARLIEDVLTRARAYQREDSPLVQVLRYYLADYRLDLKQPKQAAQMLDGVSADVLRQMIGDTHDWDSRFAYQRGRINLQTGKPKDALAEFEKALQLLPEKGPDPGVDAEDYPPALHKAMREAEVALRAS